MDELKEVEAQVEPVQAQAPEIELSFNEQEVQAFMQLLSVAMQGGVLDLVDSISHFKNKLAQKVNELNEANKGK